ncbi:hypothetical protein CTAYLR_007253 [Chrysophaeum taylorii]|uniref:ubiquitinyl hydrolase 1 n=1 Tax=Chrysophaeum taylorii TaxID=2483200 RepID=A0AAD7UC75_9STRA|nr:hypothetical protein CTAYLR_007253 [Chrysophaeum taylorii]
MAIKGLNDIASDDDPANGDASGIPLSGREMPVDGEQMPREFHGIYHEKQIGSLCAVHAMNNLVQRQEFDEIELASVAHELDAAEAAFLDGSRLTGEDSSGNVRADGFFSVQVIVSALQRFGLECAPATSVSDPARERGFIFNRREHWFALRRIGSEWFDLNSMFAAPKHMSYADLALFFDTHAHQGYSIFVVRGPYPATPLETQPAALRAAVDFCKLAAGASRDDGSSKPRPDASFAAFSGTGQRLQGPAVDPDLAAAAQADPDLAAAIAMSLSDASAPRRDAKDDADEIRRKRLARFG